MSPTLLELLVALILLVVAWRIGIILAPQIWRALGGMQRDIEEVSDEISPPPDRLHKEQEHNGTHNKH